MHKPLPSVETLVSKKDVKFSKMSLVYLELGERS